MSRTYAIADLHGRLDLLQAAYARILEDETPGTIVHLGDYVDRGPDSAGVLRFLQDPLTLPEGWYRVCLQGNHEAMMVETLTAPLNPEWWIGNGGGQTLISYGHPIKGLYDPTVVPDDDIRWLKNLSYLYMDDYRIFVHAMIDPTIPLDEQRLQTLQWGLYPKGSDMGHGEHHVVHGHHQHEKGPLLLKNRTNLDVLSWYTGRLVIGVFEDDTPGGPTCILEVFA
jgi:serine/threonine protein phosphatase 1